MNKEYPVGRLVGIACLSGWSFDKNGYLKIDNLEKSLNAEMEYKHVGNNKFIPVNLQELLINQGVINKKFSSYES